MKLKRNQRGFGLLETALSVVLAGLLVLGVWTVLRWTQHQNASIEENALLQRADWALRSYAFQYGRLPCPAVDTNGNAQASCASAASGQLPFRDIGLPDARAGNIHYAIHGVPKAGTSGINLTLDNSAQLQVQIAQSTSNPVPVSVAAVSNPLNVRSPYMALCAILSAPMSSGQPLKLAYTLSLTPTVVAATSVTSASMSSSLPGSKSNETQSLSRSFAELSTSLGCPAQIAVATRSSFNTALGAQILLRGLSDYQAMMQINLAAASADIANGAIGALVTQPAKVGAKVMNYLIATGLCTNGSEAACSQIAPAIADFIIESTYQAIAYAKIIRFSINEANAAYINYQLSQQIMAMLVIQIDQINLHAVNGLSSIYL